MLDGYLVHIRRDLEAAEHYNKVLTGPGAYGRGQRAIFKECRGKHLLDALHGIELAGEILDHSR